MKVSFEGIGESVVTFYNNGASAGYPVKMTGNGEVGACANGDRFFGVSLSSEGDFAAIQTEGYVELPYSGAAPAVGFSKLSANGSGGVKTDANGGEFLVIEVDTVNKVIGISL